MKRALCFVFYLYSFLSFYRSIQEYPTVLLFVFFFLSLGPLHVACEPLVPQPRIKPVTPTLGAWSLNHWTAREVFPVHFLESTVATKNVLFVLSRARIGWYVQKQCQ